MERVSRLTKDEIIRMYAEILERGMFYHLVEELSKVLGPKATAGIIYRVIGSTIREAIGDVVHPELVGDPLEALLVCYKLFELAGIPFEAEVDRSAGVVRVKQCPHYRFTSRNPLACTVCAAMKAGALEALTGKRVAVKLETGELLGPRDARLIVERRRHMPSGDPYCEFRVVEESG